MDYITLPRTDLKVSRICLGCWQMNDNSANVNWDAQSYETSKACVDKCLELGINFFDTAEGYAGSEQVLGKCLQGRRQEAVIASKFGFREGPNTPPYTAVQIDEAVTRSLEKLQTTYIDLLQAHFPRIIADVDEAVAELKRQVSLGRIRSFGFCNFGPKNLKMLIEKGVNPVSNQIGYNLLWRSPEREVIPICKEKDIAVLAYSPLQQGLLSGNYMTVDDVPVGRRRGKLFAPESAEKSRHGTPGCEKEMFESLRKMKDLCAKTEVPMAKAAISWVLQQEVKPVVIVGCRTPEQVVDNYNVVKISDELVKQLSDATDPVKEKIGTAMDQWVHPDRCE
ncbi:1-deoxyxylulose-5-phosphate synthase YajO-like isoform X2 [Mya arenaria]|uniref:1-deoxyxylulose-5-phosphate synthase YajO-like isoform X2 n=1 Tax=Mya arenaria TaxID=6604 RepID=UPI0022E0073D|nr:1-deoxyxylulose-5-phosphate synthase YajO-like isoform X2 [Mya arenaria]